MLKDPRTLNLRAGVRHAEGTTVTHTLAVTAAELTIACSRAIPTGETVQVTLSFPGFVEPFELEARALFSTRADGVGLPASTTLGVVAFADAARAQLEQLVALRTLPPNLGPPRSEKYKCLLVEDNVLIRELFTFAVAKYCADKGASVQLDVATSAEEGWKMVEGGRYDIAIVDHFLPGESGSTFIARVRGAARLAGLPIVAISVGGEKVRDASFDAGADLYLDKPLALRDLFMTLDKLIRRRAT